MATTVVAPAITINQRDYQNLGNAPVVPLVFGQAKVKAIVAHQETMSAESVNCAQNLNSDAHIKRRVCPAVLIICQAGAQIVGAYRDGQYQEGNVAIRRMAAFEYTDGYYTANPSHYNLPDLYVPAVNKGVSRYEIITGTSSPWGLRGYGSADVLEVIHNPTLPAWSYLTGDKAGLAFPGTTHIRFEKYRLGGENNLMETWFLVTGIGGKDARPDVVARWILVNLLNVPDARVVTDVGSDGKAASSFRTWCDVHTWCRVNRAVEERIDPRDLLSELLAACNAELVNSGDTIRIQPLDDTPNGAFVPSSTAIVLDESDIRGGIKVEREPTFYTSVPVTYKDPAKDFEEVTRAYADDAREAILGYPIIAEAVSCPWGTSATFADRMSQLLTKRSVNRRVKYTVTVSARYASLEKGDLVALSGRNIANALARIDSIEDADARTLTRTLYCWEWKQGNATPLDLTVQEHEAVRVEPSGVQDVLYTSAVQGIQATATAQSTADAAQSTADTASTTATAAQATADTAKAAADTAKAAVADLSTGLSAKAATDLNNVLSDSVAAKLYNKLGSSDNLLLNSGFTGATYANGSWGTWPEGWSPYNNGGEPMVASLPGLMWGKTVLRLEWSVYHTSTHGIHTGAPLPVNGGKPAGIQGGWQPDTWYVVSWWAVGWTEAQGHTMSLRWNSGPNDEVWLSRPALRNDMWQRYTVKIRWTGTAPEGGGRLYLTIDGNTTNATLDLAEIQVEKGETPSAWSPREVSDVAANAIGTRELAANLAILGKAYITDPENLCLNPSGECGSIDGWEGSIDSQVVAGSGAWTGFPALRFTNRDSFFGRAFPVQPGDQFWVSYDAVPASGCTAATPLQVGLICFPSASGSYNGFPLVSPGAVHNGGIQHIEGSITIPAGCYYARVWACINGPWDAGASWVAKNIQVRRKNKGKLIVDGEVVAASAQVAGTLAANALKTSGYTFSGAEGTASEVATQGAKMQNGTGGGMSLLVAKDQLKVGTYQFGPPWWTLLNSFDVVNPNTTNGYVVFCGNDQPGYRSGIPNINCLTVSPVFANAFMQTNRFVGIWNFRVQPSDPVLPGNDNLDTVHSLVVKIFTSTTATSPVATVVASVGRRGYKANGGYMINSAFAGNTYENATFGQFSWGHNNMAGLFDANSNFAGYLRCSLLNAYGQSEELDFAPASPGANCPAKKWWVTGSTGGGGSGGGGGTGGDKMCVTPWVPVNMADGTTKVAGDLEVGDLVWTRPEAGGPYGAYPVEAVERDYAECASITVRQIEARGDPTDVITIEASLTHPYDIRGRGFTEVSDLRVGDVIEGMCPGEIIGLRELYQLEVIKIAIRDAHTYETLGLRQHNKLTP